MSALHLDLTLVVTAVVVGTAVGGAACAEPTHPVLAAAGGDFGPGIAIPIDRVGGLSSARVVVKMTPGCSISSDADGIVVTAAGSDLPLEELLGDAARDGGGVVSAGRLFEPSEFARPMLAAAIGLDRYYVLRLDAGADIGSVGARLSLRGDLFERVDGDSIGELHGRARGGAWPNDPYFPEQWALENTGQESCEGGAGGRPGADIAALDAWALYLGQQPVTVAVIDGGVNEHADLVGRLVPGQNFADGGANDTGHMNNNHGTFVAGIVSAVPHNGIGIAGVSWDARIMPVRVFNDWQIGFETEVSNGLVWASDAGADIMSMSFGFGQSAGTGLLHDAVMYAHASGALLVASTGNIATQGVRFPAKFDEVMAVGATDSRDQIWNNSTTGPEVSIVAPGVGVISLMDVPSAPDTVDCGDGTSWAVGYVSGAATLIWGRHPSLSADAVRAVLELTSADLGEPGRDEVYGWGRVDAGAALEFLDGNNGVPLRRPTCQADLTGDGDVDISDLLLFLQWFAEGDPRADLSPPFGVLDFADVIAYLARFASGCGMPPLPG